jgi:hypothetical protein
MDIGYSKITIYEGSNYKYKVGILLCNEAIGQKLNFAYYDKNPLNENDNSYAFFLTIFNNNSHIDFSRLLNKNKKLSGFCKLQYFIIKSEMNPDNFLLLLSNILENEYLSILNGEKWIEIKYDLRDDYV